MSSALKMVERNEVVEVRRVPRAAKPRKLTVGDLVAAAFDAAGGDVAKVRKLLASQELARGLGRRVALV